MLFLGVESKVKLGLWDSDFGFSDLEFRVYLLSLLLVALLLASVPAFDSLVPLDGSLMALCCICSFLVKGLLVTREYSRCEDSAFLVAQIMSLNNISAMSPDSVQGSAPTASATIRARSSSYTSMCRHEYGDDDDGDDEDVGGDDDGDDDDGDDAHDDADDGKWRWRS